MRFLILAAYIALSTFQAVIICSGLVAWTGIPAAAAVPIATLLGLVPGPGTILAILAAGSAWGWPWFGSTALFCGLLALWGHVTLHHALPALSSDRE
ncbi:hypothetical protein [Inquilinus sp.]|uniref:hypothetical protein n=1 Tax=Inquilinus sp. TaxID=1932117 RepID=UPI0031D80FD5